jgi:glycosyltransferase involved in cell wall biosynthesis
LKSGAPLVTVIIPTYNQAPYLEACISSVKSQTYTRWEQIIVDDGSTDDTYQLLDTLDDPRIRVIQKEHRGIGALAETYNVALERAKGDFIAVLEGDDYWPSDKLEWQMASMASENILLSWGSGVVVDERGNRLGAVRAFRQKQPRVEFTAKALLPTLLLYNLVYPSSGVVVRRDALHRIGGFQQPPSVPYVDLPTWLGLLLTMHSEERFVFVDRLAAFWRFHAGQFSEQYTRMVASRSRLIQHILTAKISLLRDIGASDDKLASIRLVSETRSAVAQREWTVAHLFVRRCWANPDCWQRMKSLLPSLILMSASVLLKLDLFLPIFNLQRKLPEVVDLLAFGSRRSIRA